MTITTAPEQNEEEISMFEIGKKLAQDLHNAAQALGDHEARYLCDAFYSSQENRKRAANQAKAMKKTGEPTEVFKWLNKLARRTEEAIKGALGIYAKSKEVGEWSMNQYGIGPVISAGLIAHIDITKAPTVGHIWSFAGLDPRREWKKGEKRPWNARLKTLCWKIGECFLKFHKKEQCYYGKLFLERWEKEKFKNLDGQNIDQAKLKLQRFKIDKKTDAYKWYAGMVTAKAAEDFFSAVKQLEEAEQKALVVAEDNWMKERLRKSEFKINV